MRKLMIILIMLFIISGCVSEKSGDNCNNQQGCDISENTSNMVKTLDFKESYESLNGKETKSGKTYRTVTLDDTSSFILLDLEGYANMPYSDIDFTGILFISDPKCPWCRSIIETAVQVANEMNVKNIYTIHAWDEEGNEIFRDKYVEEGTSYVLQTGHQLYHLLINSEGNELLSDYIVTKSDGSSFQTGEKRIYLPSFLYVEHNKIKAFTTGISELQEGGYDELTEQMKADTKNKLEEFFKSIQ